MSDAIRDMSKFHARQLENLKRKQNHELKSIENNHETMKAELKKDQNLDVSHIQNENHKQLVSENEKKEKVLTQIKSNLDHTKQLTEKELKALEVNTEKEKNQLQTKLSEDRQRLVSENELYLEDINDRFNQASRKINLDGKERLNSVSHQLGQEYSDTETQLQSKIKLQSEKLTAIHKDDELKFKQIKDQQENTFKKERLATNAKQSVELSKMTDSHQKIAQVKDVEFRKDLKGKEIFFEKRYAEVLDKHNGEFKKLDDLHAKVVSKVKGELSEEITSKVKRSDDPFYKFIELRPTLKELPDGIEVTVSVPEHSKQDLQFTTNNKEAIINFNRRYSDSKKSETGEVSKVNKVETLTSRLSSTHILDPKSVKASYADGVMTYTVKKA